MTRHIIDHRDKPEGGRMRHYLDLDKAASGEAAHPKVRELASRSAKRTGSTRLKAFTRIERGREA